jgi:hypothetical protein
MAEPIEVDVRALNDQAYRKATALTVSPIAALLVAAGGYCLLAYLAVTQAWAFATGAIGATSYALLALLFLVTGSLLLFLMLGAGFDQAVAVRVSDRTLEFRFASSRTRAFSWDDPGLNLRFLEYTATAHEPAPGQPRMILWLGLARYAIPVGFLPEICYRARASGVYVSEAPYTRVSTGGTLTYLSRRSPKEAK